MAGRAPAEHAAHPAPPRHHRPEALLAGLRGTTAAHDPHPRTAHRGAGGSGHSLPAMRRLLDHSPRRPPARLLLAVCLFQGVTDADVLAVISRRKECPPGSGVDTEPGPRVGARRPPWGCSPRSGPACTIFTRPCLATSDACWAATPGPGLRVERTAAEDRPSCRLRRSLADWMTNQIAPGIAALAFALIDAQHQTLNRLLGRALDDRPWDEAARSRMRSTGTGQPAAYPEALPGSTGPAAPRPRRRSARPSQPRGRAVALLVGTRGQAGLLSDRSTLPRPHCEPSPTPLKPVPVLAPSSVSAISPSPITSSATWRIGGGCWMRRRAGTTNL